MSYEKIDNIIGKSSSESSDETTNVNEVKILEIRDHTIELYDITDNPKFKCKEI